LGARRRKALDRQGSIADVVVVWARSDEDGQVKGFLVETDTPGFEAETMSGKGAARAIWQAEIELDGARVPDRPGCRGRTRSRMPARCS
jgi:alkylation response protein AidB-like acyl-CoA dehydrogenase